jgi:hypothetical protein
MGLNSGKKIHRRKNFAPPQLPKAYTADHHFGVVTRYHGGAERHMDVTLYNELEKRQETRYVSLKGSIRSMKCKQRITLGAYCLVLHDQVILILTDNQKSQIPDSVYNHLSKITRSLETDPDPVEIDDIMEYFPSLDDDDEDIVFGTEPCAGSNGSHDIDVI